MPPLKWIAERSAQLPLATVAKEAVGTRLEGVLYFLPRAAFLWQEDGEHVHGLRVASRRAAATLDLFGPLLPRKRAGSLSRSLKQIRKSADEARDLDVFIARLSEQNDARAPTFQSRLHKKRRKAQHAIVDVAIPLLTDDTFASQVRRLLRKVAVSGDAPALFGEWSVQQLEKEWRLFVADLPPNNPVPDELHQFRIAGKRFRYAIEVLSGGLPEQIRVELYPQIEKLQGKLGAIQDRAVAADRLFQWQTGSRDAKEKRFLADLEAAERTRFAELAEDFRAWWQPEYVERLGQLVRKVVAGSP